MEVFHSSLHNERPLHPTLHSIDVLFIYKERLRLQTLLLSGGMISGDQVGGGMIGDDKEVT